MVRSKFIRFSNSTKSNSVTMGNSLSPSMVLGRQHTLRNNTQRILYLRERRRGSRRCSHETRLGPYSVRHDFPATIYKDHNLDSFLPSRIVVFVDKDEALDSLAPENFVQYVELIFEMDEVNNKLIVYGIPARLMDYLPRWASGRDYSDRPRDTVLSCEFKVIETENEGCLLSGQEMTMIHISITYDGKWKNNEQGGGYTWSCGANAKREVILVDGNNLTLEVVGKEICETLGLNGLETKLQFSYLPAMGSSYPYPIYVLDSRSLRTYLSFGNFDTRPMLHVENVKTNDEACGQKININLDIGGGRDNCSGFDIAKLNDN